MSVERPYVVLLGLVDTGYGMVRSLAEHNIPIIAFEKSRNQPELRTKLCQVRFFENHSDLLEQLTALPGELGHKPVLFMSSDALVKFYSEKRSDLSNGFLVHFPEAKTVTLLLEKTRFSEFAIKHNYRIPRTHVIRTTSDLEECFTTMDGPCVVKPFWRDQNWKEARFPKVFLFRKKEHIERDLPHIFAVEPNLIVQEWIPGGDDTIYFCLTYFDECYECVSSFTGRKLRQWPVGTGSTSCAEPIDEPAVTEETLRLLKSVSFAGFGSVEFKRHCETGIFYIMEPTIGRPNHQSYLATANGVNMPCDAYSALTGIALPKSKQPQHPVVWIDDPNDLFSLLVNFKRGQLGIRDSLRIAVLRKSFRFLNLRDFRPFLAYWLPVPYKLIRKVLHCFYINRRKGNSAVSTFPHVSA